MTIGIVSDIHEDIVHLKQALSILEKNKCDKLVCLGDIVGFSAPFYGYFNTRSATKCIDLIKNNFDLCVIGNHDLFSIHKLPKYKSGIKYPDDFYKLSYHTRRELFEKDIWHYDKNSLNPLLQSKDIEFLMDLNEIEILEVENYKILFTHYLYPNISGSKVEFYRENSKISQHFQFMRENDCIISFSGHTHEEGAVIFDNKKTTFKRFGKFKIKLENQTSIIGPGLANGTYANGISIFNTKTNEFKTIPLKSKKYRYPDCFRQNKNILQG